MDDPDVISVTDLHRSYGRRRSSFAAVRGVSFSVRRGELFAILGTNGAGKTSTLEVLEGLAPAGSGKVRVLGRDPYRERRSVRPHVGMMLQQSGLAADLTVAETVRMWAGTLTVALPVDEALGLVGLESRARVLVRQLSGGERRRLDLALAILGRPAVLFLDEPTTGLDPEGRLATWRLLRELLGQGTTIVLTTHQLTEAEQLADRLVIVHRGLVARTGTPAQVTAAEPGRISFRLPAGQVPPQLPGGVGTELAEDGRVVIRTTEVQLTMTALVAWASAAAVDLDRLQAHPASLEDAFLAVAGSAA